MASLNVTVRVSFSLVLEPVDWFIEPGGKHSPDIQVRQIHGYVDSQGVLSVSGKGKQVLVSGSVGNADRHAYSVRALPGDIRTRILEGVRRQVADDAAKFAAAIPAPAGVPTL